MDKLKRLKKALENVDYLGFSTAEEAIRAIETHRDWTKRWDICSSRVADVEVMLAYGCYKYASKPRYN